jgi:hypothetical protein
MAELLTILPAAAAGLSEKGPKEVEEIAEKRIFGES